MPKKATECRECGSPEMYHGSYCRPCWRIRERILIYGENPPPAKARTTIDDGDPCPGCGRSINATNRHPNYALCKRCGTQKHRDYQRERRAMIKPKPRPKATAAQQPGLQSTKKPKQEVTAVVIPADSKVIRIPSACPSFEQYKEAPDCRFYY